MRFSNSKVKKGSFVPMLVPAYLSTIETIQTRRSIMSTNPLYPVVDQQVIDAAIRKARRERSAAIWRWLAGEPIADDRPQAQGRAVATPPARPLAA
jgi:hypothetical protein